MEQHPVPQNITGFQFRLIGEMTVRQFAYLIAGSIVAVIFFNTGLPSLIRWPLAVGAFGLGFAFAFVPIEERPLDRWLGNFMKSIYHPTQFIWKKGVYKREVALASAPIITTNIPTETRMEKGPGKNINEYLESLPQETNPDTKEQESLQKISSLLGIPPVAGKKESPALQPQITVTPIPAPPPSNTKPVTTSGNSFMPTPPSGSLPPLRVRPIGEQTPSPQIPNNEEVKPQEKSYPETPKDTILKAPAPVPVYKEPQVVVPTPAPRPMFQNQPPIVQKPVISPPIQQNQPATGFIPPRIPPITPSAAQPIKRVVIPPIPQEDLRVSQKEDVQKLQEELKRIRGEKETVLAEKENFRKRLEEESQKLQEEQKRQAMTVEELRTLRETQQKLKEEVSQEENQRIDNQIREATANNQGLIAQIDDLKRQLAELQQAVVKEGAEKEQGRQFVSELQRQLQQTQIDKEIASQELSRLRQEQHKMKIAPIKPTPTDPHQTERVRFASPQKAKEAGIPIITSIPNAVNGIVTDEKGALLQGAIIIIKDHEGNPVRALKTNRLGQFLAATPLPNGPYTIEIEKEGLEFDIIEVNLNGSPISPIEIRAKENTESLTPTE